ncbi:MAG: ABC transporter permease [Deinococcota bacterium]|jgi:peptide/nickel transport system permease protein|nr:ABC transporter permease [Deinococcota bacterium]
MFIYLIRRVLQAVPLILGATIVTFVLIHVAPGDPILALAGEDGDAGYYAMMRERFGLDRPLWEQLVIYLRGVVSGDLGFSYRHNQPALAVILSRLPATLLLMAPALLLAIVCGITLGVLAANRAHSLTDASVTILSLLGQAVPVFWLAQLLLLVFAFQLELFPVQGMTSARHRFEGLRYALDVAHHMALPVAALTVQYLAPIARVTRASLVEVLGHDFIQTGLSKGLSRRQVLVRHALPNALLPVVTIIGGQVGFMLTGAVLTETVFAWPGLGRLLLSAMLNRDLAIITAMFLLLSVAVIVSTLIVDILYAVLDPRIRYE